MGSGPVLIMPPGGTTHLDWYLGDTEAHEKFCTRLAERRTLVLYDRHGCGLSDRNRTSFTPEDDMLDLETVIEALGGPVVDLFGISWGGTPSLTYAARYPERVRRMVLYGTFATGARGPGEDVGARLAALAALRRTDWELFSKTQASLFFPSGADQETFQSFARMLRDSTTPEMAENLEEVRFNNQSVLAQIMTPTLILHRRGDQVVQFVFGQYLARRLPDCRFVPLDGDAHFPWVDDTDSVLRPTIEFLTEADEVAVHTQPSPLPEGMTAILFLDIADSTALTSKLGDAAYRERERELDGSLRAAIREAGGTPVEGKVLGDGVMAVFTSARQAIEAAQRCRDLGNEASLPLHLGIHAGDVVREGNNVHGGAVQLAARVQSAAAPGEIMVSATVRDLARTSAGVQFEDRGEHELKGIAEPQRLFAVRWRS
jgi:pimeloyl-ACP methyl ester carboxylesterase